RRAQAAAAACVAQLQRARQARHCYRSTVRAELDGTHRPVFNPRQVAEASQGARVVQAHSAVGEPRGNGPAGRTDCEWRRITGVPPSRPESAREPTVTGEVPGDDPAVEPGG